MEVEYQVLAWALSGSRDVFFFILAPSHIFLESVKLGISNFVC